MTLREKQVHFLMVMVPQLIAEAKRLGYEVTGGDLFRSPDVTHGHQNSLHRYRLAIDLNLFKDGVFLQATEDHKPLGEFWESIGGSWGGRFKDGDGNHYSYAHEGMR